MNMVEKVARAICKDRAERWILSSAEERESWMETARAAIGAMKEPTSEMLQAGYGQHYRLETKLGMNKAILDHDDMIRAALKEPTQ